ncbi:hypothetical protein [Jiangella endophytica]|uniref:hypothetical protein n=1 Tax=Jiangella endophytica TaxID=1623398 RepID=UPI0013001B32|nr:hypothetical protein [Jiangella endophytica]
MLRRDTEYVLIWDAQGHQWLARPVQRDGDRLVSVAGSATAIELPAWSGRLAESWSDE